MALLLIHILGIVLWLLVNKESEKVRVLGTGLARLDLQV